MDRESKKVQDNRNAATKVPPTGVSGQFESVTETPGTPANSEQLEMLHTRYAWAAEICAGKDVLEIACGTGIGLAHLATRANRVVAGDYDPKLAASAKEFYQGKIDVQVMDAENLPLDTASVDVVLLLEAIYFLPNADRAIAEAKRVLRPGGKLLICSANCERADFNPAPMSHHYYSGNELRDVLTKHGFNAEIFACFPIANQGWKDHVRQLCRNTAIKLHLVPKSMAWKARVKRLFFGKMESLPAKLELDPKRVHDVVKQNTNAPLRNFKVIYAVGTRASQSAVAAA